MRSCYKSGKILSDPPENGISCLVRCLRRSCFRADSERRTRNLESKTAFWLSFHFSRGQHWKSRSSSFRRLSLLRSLRADEIKLWLTNQSLVIVCTQAICSETTRKHLPHRLANHWIKFYRFCNTIAWQVHTRNSIVGDSRYKLFFEVFKLQSRSQITSLCPVKCC